MPTAVAETIRSLIRDVPDFPKAGVMFRDITPLLREKFELAIEALDDLFTEDEWAKVDYVAGIESRGFIFGAALAVRRNKGFLIIRKPGKLPGMTARISYGLEYGKDSLEMQYGSGRVLIVDDVLATGGTLAAAANLAVQTNHEVVGFAMLMNLAYLNDFQWNGLKARHVVQYD